MICDKCETVAHCIKNGCVPKTTKKDEALKLALKTLKRVSEEFSIHQMDTAILELKDALASEAIKQPAQREPLTDAEIYLFINGQGDEDDDDYVEPTGDGFGLTDADLVKLIRRVEAAHGIKEKSNDL